MAPPKILVIDDNKELVNLLSQIFEDVGYAVVHADRGKAGLERAKADKPSLAILDLLLPDMMGYDVADALKRMGIPFIFITGVFRGPKQASDARLKYGAVAFFEKPFEAAKLKEAVIKVVPPPPKSEQAARPQSDFEVELDIDVDVEEQGPAMELTGAIAVSELGGKLTAVLKGEKLTAAPTAPGGAAVVRSAMTGPMVPKAPKLMVAGSGHEMAGDKSRKGEIKDNLPSLITAFWISQQTGELGLQKGKVKKVVYFEKGNPVFALSNLVSDRFGQFLVRVGKIDNEQLRKATEQAAGSGRRTGDVLIDMGHLEETERLYYVAQQVKAIVYSLFAWEEGAYQLFFRDVARKEALKMDVHPANLIVRGVKKLYKPERCARLVGGAVLMPARDPSYDLKEVELDPWEHELVPKIDGTRTVEELCKVAAKNETQVTTLLAALLAIQALEKRP